MNANRVFETSYREDITLPDGGVMRLRLARAEDRDGIIAAFNRLSAETRVQR